MRVPRKVSLIGKFNQYRGRNGPFSVVVAVVTNLIEPVDYNGLVLITTTGLYS